MQRYLGLFVLRRLAGLAGAVTVTVTVTVTVVTVILLLFLPLHLLGALGHAACVDCSDTGGAGERSTHHIGFSMQGWDGILSADGWVGNTRQMPPG